MSVFHENRVYYFPYERSCKIRTLVLNLVGLREAVYNILGVSNEKKYQSIAYKVLETATDRAKKEGKILGENIHVSMTENDGTSRFFVLDSEKYGKNSAIKDLTDESYSEGFVLDGSKASTFTDQSAEIAQCNKIHKLLNGGMLIRLQIPKEADVASIKTTIEKLSKLVPFFRSDKHVPMCGECGHKVCSYIQMSKMQIPVHYTITVI